MSSRFARHRQLRRHRRPDDGRQRGRHARPPAADQGRARHRQDAARRGSRARAASGRCIDWHIKSTTQGAAGPVRIRRGVAPARFAARRRARCTTSRNYIVKGTLWEAFESERAAGAADRRDRQGRHRVPERPAARARPHGVLRLRDARSWIKARHRPIIVITSNNEKELPDAFLRRCFFHYIRFPGRRDDGAHRRRALPGPEEGAAGGSARRRSSSVRECRA